MPRVTMPIGTRCVCHRNALCFTVPLKAVLQQAVMEFIDTKRQRTPYQRILYR